MVEGPGCTSNARTLRTFARKRVVRVVVVGEGFKDRLEGSEVKEVFSLGKELWMVFRTTNPSEGASTCQICLRVHFGMSGSVRTATSSPEGKVVRLGLTFEDGSSLQLCDPASSCGKSEYPTTISEVNLETAKARFESLKDLDVCSDGFSTSRCVAAIMALHPNTLLCDAVLNQDCCPGAGNIIKNESLHRARIYPGRTLASLSETDIRRAVKEVREYSINWFRKGRSSLVHLVYNQSFCGDCQEQVTMQKLGKPPHGPRVTFYCGTCLEQAINSVNNEERCLPALDVLMNSAKRADNKRPASTIGDRTISKKQMTNQTAATVSIKCSVHASVSLKRVRKGGPNCNRLFYSCPAKGCQMLFKWADENFPRCGCGKPSILKVSKTQESGGRWFFSCGAAAGGNKEKGCNHFVWANDSEIQPLKSLLRPLT